MLVAAKFGVPCEPYVSHWGWNLAGDWSETLKTISSVSLLAMAASFGLWALLLRQAIQPAAALDTAILVLYNCTLLSHVFSPQYLNWLMPLAVLLALNIFPRSLALWSLLAALVVAIVGISSWLFPYHWHEFRLLQAPEVDVAVIRCACLVALGLLLNIAFFARYGLVPWRAVAADREQVCPEPLPPLPASNR